MTNSLTRTLEIATAFAALTSTLPVSAQDFGETVSAAMDAIRDARDRNAAPENVKAIFAKASEAEDEGCINFCGFYLGMSEADARTLATHYGLKDGQWSFATTTYAAYVYKMTFTLHGIRKVTKGGNTFDELSSAVANRIGDMKAKRNDDYDFIGYEYKNIDGQMAFISEKGGLIIEAKREDLERIGKEAERKASLERVTKEKAERLEWSKVSKGTVGRLASDMVLIPDKGYEVCKYEVTQSLWFAVMGENPSTSKGADMPVETVSWYDCQKFLEKLNALPEVKASGHTYRLLTADEWEYACRAGATGEYCKLADGEEITKDSLGEVAWFGEGYETGATHSVGQKKPNAFGLYDMHGSVWEWTSTTDGSYRITCGGSWGSLADGCKAGRRRRYSPGWSERALGLRLATDKSR